MRIRIKIHRKEGPTGYCSLSVTAACCPKNIKSLEKSKYSLDNVKMIPKKLIYDDNL